MALTLMYDPGPHTVVAKQVTAPGSLWNVALSTHGRQIRLDVSEGARCCAVPGWHTVQSEHHGSFCEMEKVWGPHGSQTRLEVLVRFWDTYEPGVQTAEALQLVAVCTSVSMNDSTGHGLHTRFELRVGASEEKVPGPQLLTSMQLGWLTPGWNEVELQTWQTRLDEAVGCCWTKLPAEQLASAAHETLLAVAENVSPEHGRQVRSLVKVAAIPTRWPGGHVVAFLHTGWLMPSEKLAPRTQAAQTRLDTLVASFTISCPGWQSANAVQLMAFWVLDHVLLGHGEHCRSVVLVGTVLTKAPGEQTVQAVQTRLLLMVGAAV